MRAHVIGSSALYFWRHAAFAPQALRRVAPNPLADCPNSKQELQTIVIEPDLFGSIPIHLMVSAGRQRFSRKVFSYTVKSGSLPEGSFREASEGICVASPEYCLMQAAKALPTPRLLELCMELCGTYALTREKSRGFVTRDEQLMTIASLRDFIIRYSNVRLSRKLLPLLRYLAEGSHSPMETRVHLLMSLPKRLGGHGLPVASLNMRVDLDQNERKLARRTCFFGDICWPSKKVVVEYDGQDDHASLQDRANDASRQNILINKGYSVFVITSKQLFNANKFDEIVRHVARRLGFRLKNYPDSWTSRRDELRAELFKSVRSDDIARSYCDAP